MTIAALLARSLDAAGTLFVFSGCVMVFAPRAQRAWEGHLAQEAVSVCERHVGTALIGEDGVVSCLPATFSNGRLP